MGNSRSGKFKLKTLLLFTTAARKGRESKFQNNAHRTFDPKKNFTPVFWMEVKSISALSECATCFFVREMLDGVERLCEVVQGHSLLTPLPNQSVSACGMKRRKRGIIRRGRPVMWHYRCSTGVVLYLPSHPPETGFPSP